MIRLPFRGSFRWSSWSPSWRASALALSSTRVATRWENYSFVVLEPGEILKFNAESFNTAHSTLRQTLLICISLLFRCTGWTAGACIPTSTPFPPSPPDSFPRRPWDRRGRGSRAGSASRGIFDRERCRCPRQRPCELSVLTCDEATQVKRFFASGPWSHSPPRRIR